MLRFNTDIGRLEVWRGDHWGIILGESPNLGISTNPVGTSGGLGARGVFGGGVTPTPATTYVSTIEYITISSTGNAQYFGDLSVGKGYFSACSSSTRGVFGGGYTPTFNTIEYITISSTGNAQDFGDLSVDKSTPIACSNSTRGIFGGGVKSIPPTIRFNTIEYITISSTGDAVDFGDLSVDKNALSACSSSTRGVFGGGFTPTPVPTRINVIEYITISSTGNAQDFGDLSVGKTNATSCSNSTRGIFGGGVSGTYFNTIEYITISSTGNAQDFGDLSVGKQGLDACASSTRGVFGGGYTTTPAATYLNTIEYITIISTGNVVDFGDLNVDKSYISGCSNGHGGL
jgi:hypothetical protein